MWTWLSISFLAIFAAVLVVTGLVWGWMQARRRARFSEKLKVSERRETAKAGLLHGPTDEDEFPRKMLGKATHGALQTIIDQAGTTWTPVTFLCLTLALGATGILIGLVVPPLGPMRLGTPTSSIAWIQAWLPIVVLAFGLGSMPYLWLIAARKRRFAAFEEQFPEALDFLARAMSAGHGFSVGLELLPDESMDPISEEFRRVYREQCLGAPLEAALQNLAARVPSVDVKFFVAAVSVQHETGGNLGEILMQLAAVIRERFELKAEVRAASAHGRLTGVVLSILPLVLIVALLFVSPGYLEGFVKDSTGRYVLAAALVCQFIGYLFIRRIVNIKV